MDRLYLCNNIRYTNLLIYINKNIILHTFVRGYFRIHFRKRNAELKECVSLRSIQIACCRGYTNIHSNQQCMRFESIWSPNLCQYMLLSLFTFVNLIGKKGKQRYLLVSLLYGWSWTSFHMPRHHLNFPFDETYYLCS